MRALFGTLQFEKISHQRGFISFEKYFMFKNFRNNVLKTFAINYRLILGGKNLSIKRNCH